MAYTFDEQIVSDLHKDAYGCRPSEFWWQCWKEASDDERQAEWDDLLETLDRTIAREKAEEQADLEEFEKELAAIMKTGNLQREIDALQWMTPISFDEYEAGQIPLQELEHWVWERGILFTDRGREIVKKLCILYGVKYVGA